VNACEFEVIWPLSKSHYLSAGMVNMEPLEASLSRSLVARPGRETVRPDHLPKALAARALLATPDGKQQRVSDLLGVSRRMVGRMAEADFSTGLRDPQVLEEDARACLEGTARRGSTAAERAAAAWLQEAARDEHQVEIKPAATKPPASSPVMKPTPRMLARRLRRHLAPRNGSVTSTTDTPALHVAPLPQVDTLRRQQQRILHRSALIDYVLAAEKRGGETLTMGDALAELLADITDAARAIATVLQSTTGRP